MSEPIYDRSGGVVAWLDNDVIFSRDPKPVAFLDGENIVSYRSRHLGTFTDGCFRDHRGALVAFMKDASAGVMLPMTAIPPIPPIMPIAPIPPVPPIPPIPAMQASGWSQASWEEFVSGA